MAEMAKDEAGLVEGEDPIHRTLGVTPCTNPPNFRRHPLYA
jgi:hypothetical protein